MNVGEHGAGEQGREGRYFQEKLAWWQGVGEGRRPSPEDGSWGPGGPARATW